MTTVADGRRLSRVRLAVLGLHHEANTFSTVTATAADYRHGGIAVGEDLIRTYADSSATIAGYLADDGRPEVEIIPLLAAKVRPCGPVSAEAFDTVCEQMITMLRGAGRVDGVLLAIHGACVAERHPDADGDMAQLVRAVVGPDVPIGCVLDMHANPSPRLIDTVDVAVAYQTNPHVDPKERGMLCRRMVLDILDTGRRPTVVLEQLPLAVTIVRQDTSAEPMCSLLESARRVQQETDAVDVSLLEGFPYADVEQMGMSVLATHHDPAGARAAARRVADMVWSRRTDLQGGAVSVAEAVATMQSHRGERPMLVLDVGDNVGGGGPGDSTVLLRAMLDAGLGDVATTIYDPVSVAGLASRAVGERVAASVGGRSAEQEGRPVRLEGTITGRHTGPYDASGIAHGGFRVFDGGEMVGLRTDDGVAVVLTSKPVQPVTPAQLEVVGLDVAVFRAVMAKGVNGPRAGYAGASGEVLVVDTPGVTQNTLQRFTYHHRRRPMYPFEPDAHYRGVS